jgi:processive 1,2-diacylglycerol beta-glucosyltransferase
VSFIERERPTAVVCTHFLPLEALAPRRRRGLLACPLYCVITDFTAHPFWAIDGIDASFVATAAVREELAAWGVAWDSIHVSGIPIDPRFAQGPLDRAEARAQFQLAPDRPTVLLMGGGNGVGPLASLAECVLDLPSAPQLLVVCGKNARRMRIARGRRGGARARARARLHRPGAGAALGCGRDRDQGRGLTCSESLAMQTPMVVFRPTPGRRKKLARPIGCRGGGPARTFEQVGSSIERILAYPPSRPRCGKP